MNPYRPVLQIPKTRLQTVANCIGYGLFVGSIIYVLIKLQSLPPQVPIHFNALGEEDGWGSKNVLLIFPFIALFLWLALEALEKNPHVHNYPSHINEANVQQFYSISIRTTNLMKNGILIFFSLLQLDIVFSAQQQSFTLGILLMIVLSIVIVVPIVTHIMSIRKINYI